MQLNTNQHYAKSFLCMIAVFPLQIFIQNFWNEKCFFIFLLDDPPLYRQTTGWMDSLALTAVDLTEGTALCQATPKGFSRPDSQNTSKKGLTLTNPEMETGSGTHFSEIQPSRSSFPVRLKMKHDFMRLKYSVSCNSCTTQAEDWIS